MSIKADALQRIVDDRMPSYGDESEYNPVFLSDDEWKYIISELRDSEQRKDHIASLLCAVDVLSESRDAALAALGKVEAASLVDECVALKEECVYMQQRWHSPSEWDMVNRHILHLKSELKWTKDRLGAAIQAEGRR